MRSKSKYSVLNNYKRYLRTTHPNPFQCRFCEETIYAYQYEQHILDKKHPLDIRTQCPWCNGIVYWKLGEKYKYASHLCNCAKLFFFHTNSPVTYTSLSTFDYTPEYPTKDFFGHTRILSPDYYEVPERYLFRFDAETLRVLRSINAITFPSEAINLAKDFLLYYLHSEKFSLSHFKHIMVRYVAIGTFFQNFDKYGAKILPFYCFCKGGEINEDHFRDHIHMIVATTSWKEFKVRVWDKTKSELSPPHPNYNCKFSKEIKSPLHFLNTIGYLSGRLSRCNFGKKKLTNEKLNHFNLQFSFPKNFKYCLSMLWPEGLLQHIIRRYKQYQPLIEEGNGLVHREGQWMIQYAYLPGLMDILTSLPILHLLNETTESFLHLGGKIKMNFAERLSEYTAFKYIEFFGYDYFVFGPSLQGIFNFAERCCEIRVRNLKRQLDEAKNVITAKETDIENLQKFLMNDKEYENMDTGYDLSLQVKPYKTPNPSDRVLLKVCEEIIQSMMNMIENKI